MGRQAGFQKQSVVGLMLLAAAAWLPAQAVSETFDDRPLSEEIILPDWFKPSFLELQEDLDEAMAAGKRGLIVYFGQKYCPYCKALLDNNWGQADILSYTLQHFDVIAIDVTGQQPVVDFDSKSYTERDFAIALRTNFTPSLIFYADDSEPVLNLRGYRPPYQFRAALEYVADQHYAHESFAAYLARAEPAASFSQDELNRDPRFRPPPFELDRSRQPAPRPLLVSFERKRCHACDVLHAGPMQDQDIGSYLEQVEMVQLDMQSDTPLQTPDGRRLSARDWATELELDYAPSLLLFDEHGREIVRVDSVVGFFRLRNVLSYVISKGYQEYPTYQAWTQRPR